MKRISRFLFPFVALFAFFGCSNTYKISITPQLAVSPSQIGENKEVNLQVTDARSSNIIAKWKSKLSVRKFRITPDTDVQATIDQKVTEGLKRLGFRPKPHLSNTSKRRFKVEILQIRSAYREKISRLLDIRVKASLRATCTNQGLSYQKVYSKIKERKNILPTLPNEKLVNLTVSGAMSDMFADTNLIGCLAR